MKNNVMLDRILRRSVVPAAVVLALSSFVPLAIAAPTVGETVVLGPWTGEGASLHPDNLAPHRLRYYGTDLGFTYEHQGKLQLLFGDTMATEDGEPIGATADGRLDDSFGSVDLEAWRDPGQITPENMPLIRLGQNAGTSETSTLDPGHALEGFKTPVGGFSNGRREFALFFTSKPQGCTSDADCPNGLSCDSGVGFVGERYSVDKGLTLPCLDGSAAECIADTMVDASGAAVANSGFCADPASSIRGTNPAGRLNAVAVKLLVSIRSTENPGAYSGNREWLTNRFLNVALRREQQRVYLWGRPGFIGVNRRGRTLGLYFAYADMPEGPDFAWNVHYYAGTDRGGAPRFSTLETEALPVDLDSTQPGMQTAEVYDVVNQISVAWVAHLKKWVMFYGGGISDLPYLPSLPNCGVLELFTGPDCKDVMIGSGSIHMRTADQPWGPWTPPQDVITGGDPVLPGSGQYGPGGMLRHPLCLAPDCAPHTAARDVRAGEYGFLYSANIIEQWIRPVGASVELLWNASTWDPYRIILLRTRIDP